MMPAQTTRSDNLPISGVSNHSQIGTLLHSLSNKLLPIVVFSELALRRCGDPTLKPQLEKIYEAAEQARELLVEIRNIQAKDES
jgi:hypothetical protein